MNRYTHYILESVSTIAKSKYPNDPQSQLHYQVGFLASLFATSVHEDSKNWDLFIASIKRAQAPLR